MKLEFDKNKIYPLSLIEIEKLKGLTGVYFIFLNEIFIPYPLNKSRLIYIGMSESIENSLEGRLKSHVSVYSNNAGIRNYFEKYQLFFTFHTIELLKHLSMLDIPALENYFIADFVEKHGVYPICNNRNDLPLTIGQKVNPFEIGWEFWQ